MSTTCISEKQIREYAESKGVTIIPHYTCPLCGDILKGKSTFHYHLKHLRKVRKYYRPKRKNWKVTTVIDHSEKEVQWEHQFKAYSSRVNFLETEYKNTYTRSDIIRAIKLTNPNKKTAEDLLSRYTDKEINTVLSDRNLHTIIDSYICPLCNKKLKSKAQFKAHVKHLYKTRKTRVRNVKDIEDNQSFVTVVDHRDSKQAWENLFNTTYAIAAYFKHHYTDQGVISKSDLSQIISIFKIMDTYTPEEKQARQDKMKATCIARYGVDWWHNASHTGKSKWLPKLGKNETSILDDIAKSLKVTISRSYPVGRYFVDGYDEANNIVYEVYEKYHLKESQLERDISRMEFIKNKLQCEFIIIEDF